MSRSILSVLCFILVPGLCLVGLYNIQTARFHSHVDFEAPWPEVSAIPFGSLVTLRHLSASGNYLHSHSRVYPEGSRQQQVSLVPERIAATKWRVYNASANYSTRTRDALQHPRLPIPDASTLKLEHVVTGKHLHSHDILPPVSKDKYLQEVSAYGFPGFVGDANDSWDLELTEDSAVLTMASPVRLRHMLTGCFLSAGGTLPEWGLGLREVICTRGAVGDLWLIEEAL
ncbi:MIR motif-containing protein [Mycena rosella]|uniref:MIR motif-containing protein n=1 Tax=Mycena rosella TaxID=1033263 RepID=A0AAD7GMA7_MYCRO|nr:MIR motif-containing protein [Mycena rosella]